MKTTSTLAALIFGLSILSSGAFARELNCRVSEIRDTSFFEESLSLDEYPDVQMRPDVLVIGSQVFPVDDREFIQYRDQSFDGKDQSVTLVHKAGQLKYDVKFEHGLGQLTGQNAGDVEKLIANFDCD